MIDSTFRTKFVYQAYHKSLHQADSQHKTAAQGKLP
jgi:hypothetical protein